MAPFSSALRLFALVMIILLLLVSGCDGEARPTATPRPGATSAAVSATPTGSGLRPLATTEARATSAPTNTSTPTHTPSPTPTPTATAQPAQISGDPRTYVLEPPEPQPGARCGVVDIFDFPVDPPHAVAVNRGGTDFNVYRERYNGFHAGEDWSGPNGRGLGAPVYSVGHGEVIYAHPNGWGIDRGTLIIRHVLPGGRSILSFYGHLDPPSVTLRRGACVARGEQVGEIGDPRGRPHLHFEIRDHTPADPGPGYWYENPVLGGWYPPSQTIWASRYGASPGVLWARPPEDDDFFPAVAPVGFLPDGVLVLLEAGRLVGVGSADGGVRWRQPEPVVPTPTPGPDGARPDATRMALQVVAASPVAAVLDDAAPVVYTVDRRGRLQAHATEGEVPVFDPLWQVRLNMVGTPALAPLPGGGVVVVGRRSLVATNAGGAELWRAPLDDWAGEAVRAGDRLFLPVGRGETVLWELTQSGATPLPDLPAGTPVGRPGGLLWLYARDGVYHLNPQQNRATLAKALPPALYGAALRHDGGALALPDGGLLVAHPDLYDSRLLRLDPRGALIWERSYRAAGAARAAGASGGRALAQLAFADGRPFLAVVEEGPTMLVTVYAVDLDSGNLERLFVGGARGGNALNTWLIAAPDGLLLNIGGGHLVALDPPAALDALRAAR